MSFATLEREVLHEAREVFKNRKLRNKDIIEWTTGKIEKRDGEVVARLPHLGIEVAVAVANDKRAPSSPVAQKEGE